MKNKILLLAAVISFLLLSGCGIMENVDSATGTVEYTSAAETTVTVTAETTINFSDNTTIETTEEKTVPTELTTESEAVTTTEEQTTETTTANTAEEKSTYKSPEYIENYKFTDEDKKQLERECYIMAALRLDDFIIFSEDNVTEEYIDNYVFSTFGNGEGIWGLDYIETFDLSKQADPLGKFRDAGLCDVFDAEGVDKFLLDVFSYEATHNENYGNVYYHDGKYYKYTGDGGGYETFALADITSTKDGRYLAKFNYTDYENNYLPVYALFSVFDDTGRIRFHYSSVTTLEPAVRKNGISDNNKWYHEVIQQYDTAFAIPGCADFIAENPDEYIYVPSMAAYAFERYGSKTEMYFYDIDNNGTEELICAYNIYLYDEGKIHMLFDPDGEHVSLGDRSSMEIYENGVIGVHWAGGAVTFINEYFTIDGTELKTIDKIYYDEWEDEDNPVWKSDNPDKHYPSDKFEEFTSVYGNPIDLTPYRVN